MPRRDSKVKMSELSKIVKHQDALVQGYNISENNLARTIFELDLCILVTYLYSEFQLKMFMNDRDNELQP